MIAAKSRPWPRLGKRGNTALEFAFVAPAMCGLMIATVALCLGVWTWNALQESAFETARCLAIGSTLCASVPLTGCDSTSAGTCYAESQAALRGVPGVNAAQITVNAAASTGCGATASAFTQVAYAYQFSLLGYHFPFGAEACYPNN